MAASRCASLLVVVAISIWSSAAGAALQPHVAAYRLSLADQRDPSTPLVEVRGGLVIEWRLACDGWLSRQRLAFVAVTEEGQDLSHDVRFTSWEATDGRRMRYSYRSYDRDELTDDFRGEAWLDPADGGMAIFSAPSEREVRLPPGTVFPTEHIRDVLDLARAGERFASHHVFDGAGFDALTQITSVIGQPRMVEPLAEDTAASDRAWPVSMAYYDLEDTSDTPKFQARFLLGEDGILRDIVLDYGEFQLDAALETVEPFERPDC